MDIDAWSRQLDEYMSKSLAAKAKLEDVLYSLSLACDETRAFWEYQAQDMRKTQQECDAAVRAFRETRPIGNFKLDLTNRF